MGALYCNIVLYEGYLSHGGTPVHHPFFFGIFHVVNHPASLGYPHGYGNLSFHGLFRHQNFTENLTEAAEYLAISGKSFEMAHGCGMMWLYYVMFSALSYVLSSFVPRVGGQNDPNIKWSFQKENY